MNFRFNFKNQPAYELRTDADNGVALLPVDLDYFQDHFAGRSMIHAWRPPKTTIWAKSKPIRDFVSWMLVAPVLSERARVVFEPLLGGDVEWLPMRTIGKRQLFAVNVLRIAECVDKFKTWELNESREIDALSRIIFDQAKVPNEVAMFKIPHEKGGVYVTRPFVDQIIAHQLTGALLMNPAANSFSPILPNSPDVWIPVPPARRKR